MASPCRWEPAPLRCSRARRRHRTVLRGQRRGDARWATSSGNGGRNYLGMVGDIIPESRATSIAIRTNVLAGRIRRSASCAALAFRFRHFNVKPGHRWGWFFHAYLRPCQVEAVGPGHRLSSPNCRSEAAGTTRCRQKSIPCSRWGSAVFQSRIRLPELPGLQYLYQTYCNSRDQVRDAVGPLSGQPPRKKPAKTRPTR